MEVTTASELSELTSDASAPPAELAVEGTVRAPSEEQEKRNPLKKRKITKGKVIVAIFIILMLIYPLFRFAIMWGYINIKALYVSFTRYDLLTDSNIFAGFLQYKLLFRRLASDEYTKHTLITSALYFVVTCGISLPLSVIFSYFLFKKVPAAGVYRVIFYLPSILPVAVLALTFRYSFGSEGYVDQLLHSLGFQNLPLWWGDSNITPIMVFVYCIWAGLGLNIVLFSGAMSRVPKEILEYDQLEGVGMARELFQVMLPCIWPTFVTTFMLGMTSVLTVYLQPYFLMDSATTTPFNTCTISLYIFNNYATPAQAPYLAAFGLFCSAVFVPIVLGTRAFLNRFFRDVGY